MKPAEFWEWFLRSESALWAQSAKVAERIQERLAEYDDRLWVEVSSPSNGRRELTFSCGGAVDRFAVVDELVNAAPTLERWVVFALNPPRGFQFVIEHKGHRLVANSLEFQASPQSENSGAVALRVLVDEANLDDGLVEGIWQLLAMGLGERQTAERIASVEVASKEAAAGDRAPLFALPSYLAWLDAAIPPARAGERIR